MTGNGGTAMGDKVTNVAIGVSDFAKLTEFATQHNVRWMGYIDMRSILIWNIWMDRSTW